MTNENEKSAPVINYGTKEKQWREEFEVWYPTVDDHPNFKRGVNDNYVSIFTDEAWESYKTACKKRTEEQRVKNLEALRAFKKVDQFASCYISALEERFWTDLETIKSALEA